MLISCHTMRASVILSALLSASGGAALLFAEATGLVVPTAHLALFLLLAGAGTLAAAFVLAILPGPAQCPASKASAAPGSNPNSSSTMRFQAARLKVCSSGTVRCTRL